MSANVFFDWPTAAQAGKAGFFVRRNLWTDRWLQYYNGLGWLRAGTETPRVVKAADFGRDEFLAADWTNLPPECVQAAQVASGQACPKPFEPNDPGSPEVTGNDGGSGDGNPPGGGGSDPGNGGDDNSGGGNSGSGAGGNPTTGDPGVPPGGGGGGRGGFAVTEHKYSITAGLTRGKGPPTASARSHPRGRRDQHEAQRRRVPAHPVVGARDVEAAEFVVEQADRRKVNRVE